MMVSTSFASPPAVRDDLCDVVRKGLERSPEPLSAARLARQLTGPFRQSAKALQPVLDEMAERGEIHKLPKYAGTHRYWTHDLESFAREKMLRVLSESPLTRSELKQKVKAQLRGFSENRRRAILTELIQQGRIHELPPLVGARTKRLSTRTADPREYLRDAVEKVCRQLAKADVSRDAVWTVAREIVHGTEPEPVTEPEAIPDLEELILSRMSHVEPRAAQGAMVSIAELRQVVDFQHRRKGEFDQAVWRLVQNAKVDVHRHDFPARLTPEQREGMLADDHGNYYNGISRRVY